MCHAPLVIPELAGKQVAHLARSTEAMRKAAEFLVAKDLIPDALVILSPHFERRPTAFTLLDTPSVSGSFKQYGKPRIELELPLHKDAIHRLSEGSRQASSEVSFERIQPSRLDHGTLVPLYFLKEAGWRGKTIVAGFPYLPSQSECEDFGKLIKKVSDELKENWAICASGELSHKLKPGAPAGYHPRAADFDFHLREHLADGDIEGALKVDPALRSFAEEDILDSLRIAGSATQYQSKGFDFYSYEAPFGIGYLVSSLYDWT